MLIERDRDTHVTPTAHAFLRHTVGEWRALDEDDRRWIEGNVSTILAALVTDVERGTREDADELAMAVETMSRVCARTQTASLVLLGQLLNDRTIEHRGLRTLVLVQAMVRASPRERGSVGATDLARRLDGAVTGEAHPITLATVLSLAELLDGLHLRGSVDDAVRTVAAEVEGTPTDEDVDDGVVYERLWSSVDRVRDVGEQDTTVSTVVRAVVRLALVSDNHPLDPDSVDGVDGEGDRDTVESFLDDSRLRSSATYRDSLPPAVLAESLREIEGTLLRDQTTVDRRPDQTLLSDGEQLSTVADVIAYTRDPDAGGDAMVVTELLAGECTWAALDRDDAEMAADILTRELTWHVLDEGYRIVDVSDTTDGAEGGRESLVGVPDPDIEDTPGIDDTASSVREHLADDVDTPITVADVQRYPPGSPGSRAGLTHVENIAGKTALEIRFGRGTTAAVHRPSDADDRREETDETAGTDAPSAEETGERDDAPKHLSWALRSLLDGYLYADSTVSRVDDDQATHESIDLSTTVAALFAAATVNPTVTAYTLDAAVGATIRESAIDLVGGLNAAELNICVDCRAPHIVDDGTSSSGSGSGGTSRDDAADATVREGHVDAAGPQSIRRAWRLVDVVAAVRPELLSVVVTGVTARGSSEETWTEVWSLLRHRWSPESHESGENERVVESARLYAATTIDRALRQCPPELMGRITSPSVIHRPQGGPERASDRFDDLTELLLSEALAKRSGGVTEASESETTGVQHVIKSLLARQALCLLDAGVTAETPEMERMYLENVLSHVDDEDDAPLVEEYHDRLSG